MKKYDLFIIALAITSISLTILDFTGSISLKESPYLQIDWSILGIFAYDYIFRFTKAENKAKFFRQNLFDLLAIIPFDSMLSFFRIARIFRITRMSKMFKFAKFLRVFGISGKLGSRLKVFFNTNGFIYLLYTSFALIFTSSIIYSNFEKIPFAQAVWWSIVTTTTVGYGDISPVTSIGKITAIILMLLGISIIGMLSSTIVSFFNNEKDETAELKEEIKNLNTKLDLLIQKIDEK
ncbi:ion transporter [Lactococcus hodotermopsidis]|uniref:Ion transporter n=1 Tax=Pseudolactococcus hodotermopsidis TaxID=2709157 RepID=A0A6A0BFB3_9LACT|nr:potassium channel family protein [Lactococcus hodotermopsidis]GFH43393.1 ion transporter [Lactococcus hodotermopsidis]